MHTNMKVVRGKLKIGTGPCHQCYGRGTVHPTEVINCKSCFGRGEIKCFGRLGAFMRTCGKCKGAQKVEITNRDKDVSCPRCKGVDSKKFEQGTHNAYVHQRILNRIPHKVYRVKGVNSWLSAEGHMTFGRALDLPCFANRFSTLYGANEHRRHTADLLKKNCAHSASASQISKVDGTLCDHIGIFVMRDVVVTAAVFADTQLPDFIEPR